MDTPIYYFDCDTSVQTMLKIIGAEVDNNHAFTETEEWEALDPIFLSGKALENYTDNDLFAVFDMFTFITWVHKIPEDISFDTLEEFLLVKADADVG